MGKILSILVMLTLAYAPISFAKDGMPSPWPFPFAKDCPMAWDNLGGLYNMSDSNTRDQILVKVNEGDDASVKVIRVVRMSSKGRARAFGLAMVLEDEREFHVHMIPATKSDGPDTWVGVRMYYTSLVKSCEASYLVPIMTVSRDEANTDQSDYVLIRQQAQGPKK
jgi:hypothetical protein